MKIDEAIKHAEGVAEENSKSHEEWLACKNRGNVGWSKSDIEAVDKSIEQCKKCAEEHRQLAEWLKDYKRLKEQEPCEDAASREAVMHILDEVGGDFDSPREAVVSIDYIADMVAELPSVTPQQKMGRWITWKEAGNDIPSETRFECSVCHDAAQTLCNGLDLLSTYCPNCGAKMQEVEE